jgi:co-chaperonin GroES (HSP10)
MNKGIPIAGGVIIIIAIIVAVGATTMSSEMNESTPTVNLDDSIAVEEQSGKSFDIGINEGLNMGDSP